MNDVYLGDKQDQVIFRCSQADKIDIMTRAGELGVSLSSYCRMAALDELPNNTPQTGINISNYDDLIKVISFAAAVLTSTGIHTKDANVKKTIKAETLKIRNILEEL